MLHFQATWKCKEFPEASPTYFLCPSIGQLELKSYSSERTDTYSAGGGWRARWKAQGSGGRWWLWGEREEVAGVGELYSRPSLRQGWSTFSTMGFLLAADEIKQKETAFFRATIYEVKSKSSCLEFFSQYRKCDISLSLGNSASKTLFPSSWVPSLQSEWAASWWGNLISFEMWKKKGKVSMFVICTAYLQELKIFSISRIIFVWPFQ